MDYAVFNAAIFGRANNRVSKRNFDGFVGSTFEMLPSFPNDESGPGKLRFRPRQYDVPMRY